MYKTYEFATVCVGVQFNGEYILKKCKGYETDKEPFFTLEITEKDVEYEKQLFIKERNGKCDFSYGYLEFIAFYRKFVEKAIDYGVVLFHGSAVAYKDRAYLYVAPSGTGKSTHVRIIKTAFNDEAEYINDDKPLFKQNEKGEWYVYGSPWDGKHRLSNNVSKKLGAICILERGEQNSITRLSDTEAVLGILLQSYRPTSEESSIKYFNLITSVLTYPVYRLKCNVSKEAGVLSITEMSKEY